MQSQLFGKLLSKIPRNCSSTNASLISPKSVFSSTFLKTNANRFHQRSFSEYSTLSRFHLRKICSSNGVSGKSQNGVFSSSILARRFFSNTLLKRRTNFPVNGEVRTNTRRNLHSFDFQNRGWRSVFRRLTPDGVVLGLIITNVAVFFLWNVASPVFMVKNFMISVDNFTSGRLHTLITSVFSYRDPFHLITNMVGLFFFGTNREQTFGIDPSKIPGLGIFIIGKDIVRVLQGDQQISGSAYLGGATVATLAYLRSRRERFRRF